MIFEGKEHQMKDEEWIPAPVKKGFFFFVKSFVTKNFRETDFAKVF